jgi:hypothetical protein
MAVVMAVVAVPKTKAATAMVGGTDNNLLNAAAEETAATATATATVTGTAMAMETAMLTAKITTPMPTTAHRQQQRG